MKTALINIQQNPNWELIVYYTKPLMCNYYRGNVHFTQELVYNTWFLKKVSQVISPICCKKFYNFCSKLYSVRTILMQKGGRGIKKVLIIMWSRIELTTFQQEKT